jgi:hypothetical protein
VAEGEGEAEEAAKAEAEAAAKAEAEAEAKAKADALLAAADPPTDAVDAKAEAGPERVERGRRPTKPGDSSKAVKVDPKVDPKPKDGGPISVECVIDPSKCDRKGKPKPPVDTGDGEPDGEPSKALASAPSTAQIRAAMTPVKPQAKACAPRHGGKAGDTVRVKLSVSGPTGKVLSAQALDDHAGTSLGKCVADALGKAELPKFGKPQAGIVYAVKL